MEKEIDASSYITDLRKWPISLETQAWQPEIAILSEYGAHISFCLSEIELVAGNRGVAVSLDHDAHEPTSGVAHINDPLPYPLSTL